MNPSVKALVIHVSGQERDVDADLYEIQLQNPGCLLEVVARLMKPLQIHLAGEGVVERHLGPL